MRHVSKARRAGAALGALWLIVTVLSGLAPAAHAAGGANVEQRLLDQFARKDEATYWVVLREQADLSGAKNIKDWNARGRYVYDQLRQTADRSQGGLRSRLSSLRLDYRPFWIINAVRVTSSQATMLELANRADVWQVLATQQFRIPQPQPSAAPPGTEAVEWNIQRINAPQVWSTFLTRGEGVVVANVDTGVAYQHPALVAQYRGNLGGGSFDHNYNWFDPANICGSPSLAPCDNIDHGTHTMGTMVGDDGGSNQIGVAPGARWIAAKGCETNSCSDFALLSSGEWILAPTDLQGNNPRPDLRPNVVNNSWGNTDGSNLFYQATVQAWVASGIFPAFSNGNSGPSCGTAGSPGSYPETFSAGAFDINNVIATFSSRGPSPLGGIIKPNIAAPGVGVRSSVPPSNYAVFDGTSMASPHVAGTVALMISAAPALFGAVDEIETVLGQSAIDTSDLQCGGAAGNNNVWGEGRLDALAAVEQSPRGPTGTLRGKVSDAITSHGIAGAEITVIGPSNRTTFTDNRGAYSMILPVGSYSLTASAFFYRDLDRDTQIVQDTTTTVNFPLFRAPAHAVSGIVRDADGNAVAGATVTIEGTPIPPTTTDSTGAYSFASVPEGSYDVAADAGGCNDTREQTLIVDGDEALDFVLPALSDAFGHTCKILGSASYVQARTVLPLTGDDETLLVTLPFPFRYYGQTYQSVSIATNGFVTFGSEVDTWTNDSIPSPAVPNGAIYAYWDDLIIDGQSSVRTQVIGAQPNRRFVIEWRNATYYQDDTRRVSFEVILSEATYDFTVVYRQIAADDRERGSSATLGIENAAGDDALEFSFDFAAIRSPGFALRYSEP
jgi:subtilisin family serine protease